MSTLTPRALGLLLREERERQHLTQRELGKKAGLSVSVIGKVERSTEDAPLREILSVIFALGLNVGFQAVNTSAPER